MENNLPESAFSTSSRGMKIIASLAVYYSNFVLVSEVSIETEMSLY